MDLEEHVAQIAGALARADDSRPWTLWVKLVKEEKLDLGVDLVQCFLGSSRNHDLKGFHMNILEHLACLVPRGADKL
jgi:hypothetical protein